MSENEPTILKPSQSTSDFFPPSADPPTLQLCQFASPMFFFLVLDGKIKTGWAKPVQILQDLAPILWNSFGSVVALIQAGNGCNEFRSDLVMVV